MTTSSDTRVPNHLPLLPGNVYENNFKTTHHKDQLFVRSSMGSMGNNISI